MVCTSPNTLHNQLQPLLRHDMCSPGRFHATMVIKIALSQLLLNYDLLLEKESARNKWYWETFALPYESTRIVLKPRNF